MNNFIKISICLILLSVIPSCKNRKDIQPSKTNVMIEKKDGLIYKQNSNKPYTGIIIDTINEKVMEYYVKDGLKDGRFKISDLNGRVEMAGNMVKDKNEGEWKYYYPNGKIESEGNFSNDTASGDWSFYYETGIIKEEGKYVKGKRDGKWTKYDSTGRISQFITFAKGDTVK